MLIPGGTGHGLGEPRDYRFELVGRPVKVNEAVRFAVQLVRAADGAVIIGATITATDFNMSPEGMVGSNPVSSLPVVDPGVQPFEVNPEMPGRWELLLRGQVRGEDSEITGRLVVTVPK